MEMAFKLASRQAFKQAFLNSQPVILEPIMKVEVETPSTSKGLYKVTFLLDAEF